MTRASATRWKKRAKRQQRLLAVYARRGTLSAGARAAGVPRRVAQDWIDTDPRFRARVEEAHAVFLDSIEERMFRIARQGNAPMLRFIAKTNLKLRGSPPPRDTDAIWEELERTA